MARRTSRRKACEESEDEPNCLRGYVDGMQNYEIVHTRRRQANPRQATPRRCTNVIHVSTRFRSSSRPADMIHAVPVPRRVNKSVGGSLVFHFAKSVTWMRNYYKINALDEHRCTSPLPRICSEYICKYINRKGPDVPNIDLETKTRRQSFMQKFIARKLISMETALSEILLLKVVIYERYLVASSWNERHPPVLVCVSFRIQRFPLTRSLITAHRACDSDIKSPRIYSRLKYSWIPKRCGVYRCAFRQM